MVTGSTRLKGQQTAAILVLVVLAALPVTPAAASETPQIMGMTDGPVTLGTDCPDTLCSPGEASEGFAVSSISTIEGNSGDWWVHQPQLGQVASAQGTSSLTPEAGPHDGTWVIVFRPDLSQEVTQGEINVKIAYVDDGEEKTLQATAHGFALGTQVLFSPLVWIVNLHSGAQVFCLPGGGLPGLGNSCPQADTTQAADSRFFVPDEIGDDFEALKAFVQEMPDDPQAALCNLLENYDDTTVSGPICDGQGPETCPEPGPGLCEPGDSDGSTLELEASMAGSWRLFPPVIAQDPIQVDTQAGEDPLKGNFDGPYDGTWSLSFVPSSEGEVSQLNYTIRALIGPEVLEIRPPVIAGSGNLGVWQMSQATWTFNAHTGQTVLCAPALPADCDDPDPTRILDVRFFQQGP